ncbi:nicotinamide riboside transporter PnuC [Sphingobacterium griseoflavum]|uniref:Nicotinamide riboside transporter PnuC n=1 Tax=Sphingobacterium griseoflavum TaxID=1474952 RepID=A0ABQ3HZ91_9SPHI|nr:nicotinamide riboside transporter PnuC [Sphingobacterium griseoflavum]GHE34061.1 membrane protein [Sphingobacterium griseoflavum]
MTEFTEQVSAALAATSWTERFAVGFSVVQVILSSRNKISNYFFGIVSIILTISVLFQARLYAEILLHVYYFVMSVYGLWYWKYRFQHAEVAITRCSTSEWRVVWAIVGLGYIALFLFLRYLTDSDVPVFDAIVSSTAWAGMWLLAKRKIENWILLNISNFIAIPLLFYKELYLFACLTIFLFIVAIVGYLNWRAMMKKQSNRPAYVA